MSPPDLPSWASLPVSLLVLLGAGLALTGALGLLRFKTFYERVHAPTLASTLGAGCILVASVLYFSVLESRPVLHELLIAAVLVITTPITLLLLVRAALYRDRHAGNDAVPAAEPPSENPRGSYSAREEKHRG